ncbi:GNAT family N-acetyltransferase [Microcoleus sp. FACHB-672]|uniref:GNAT family N-acetyltransferase n=1 Tax=Microcoleus sp. FACHB-672 TaxID=2692825 RepID=UPI001689B3DC|nr:GNAT family protein [Microcoleus sp. FACHB-672]MBD2039668.1 GNAT family N-acetyltransferase [Microcoleus sp. FACHB-672]
MIFSNLLRGDRIRLTALTSKDLTTVAGWHEDADFLRMVDARPATPQTEELLTQWLEERHKATDAFVLAMRGKSSDDLIGVIEFEGILWTHQVSWMSIAIGNRSNWGKGYGYDAMQLALVFAFDELNLYRVQLTVFSYNERAIALYEKLGFHREGVYRQFLQRDGKRYDMYLYGLLRPEWENVKIH